MKIIRRKKILVFAAVLLLQAVLLNTALSSCGYININSTKHYKELEAAYSYDSGTQVLKKFASEIMVDEQNELLSFDGKSVKPLEYQTIVIEGTISITYTIHNGELIIAEVPEMQMPYKYFTIGSSTDSVIVINSNYAYLVNLNDLSADRLNMELQPDETVSISPDGKYFLYFRNGSLYSYDMSEKTNTEIMNFYNMEFLCWEKDVQGSFLYREKMVSVEGIDIYSNIYRGSVTSSAQTSSVFLEIEEKYSQYEMIDDQRIYAYSYKSTKDYMHGVLYIRDIYTQEVKAVVLPRYPHIWDISLSEDGEYAALCAMYIDASGNQVSRLITVNLSTNDIRFYYELGYEIGMENYGMHSFYWCPQNILIVNFINTRDLYNDLCLFHRVKHTKSNIPKIDIEDIIYKDSINYEEEEE